MPEVATSVPSRQRLLDPVSRISEVLFGLIMVLTFTGAINAADAKADVHSLLVAAIGCNLAWGLVDAVMYMTMGLVERAHDRSLVRSIRAAEPGAARKLIKDELPPVVAGSFDDGELELLRQNLVELSEVPSTGATKNDWLSALGVFLLVFLSTFPVVIPFIVFDTTTTSIRWSNLIAILMMYACGHALGAYAGLKPFKMGLAMTALGVVLVVLTIALGG